MLTESGRLEDAIAAFRRAIAVEQAVLNRGTSFLATTASASPFIGLFGTVVGIMVAFTLLVIFIIIAWPLATIICAMLARAVLFVYDRFPVATNNFIRGPLRFFVFIAIARLLIDQLGLSLTALQPRG